MESTHLSLPCCLPFPPLGSGFRCQCDAMRCEAVCVMLPSFPLPPFLQRLSSRSLSSLIGYLAAASFVCSCFVTLFLPFLPFAVRSVARVPASPFACRCRRVSSPRRSPIPNHLSRDVHAEERGRNDCERETVTGIRQIDSKSAAAAGVAMWRGISAS